MNAAFASATASHTLNLTDTGALRLVDACQLLCPCYVLRVIPLCSAPTPSWLSAVPPCVFPRDTSLQFIISASSGRVSAQVLLYHILPGVLTTANVAGAATSHQYGPMIPEV